MSVVRSYQLVADVSLTDSVGAGVGPGQRAVCADTGQGAQRHYAPGYPGSAGVGGAPSEQQPRRLDKGVRGLHLSVRLRPELSVDARLLQRWMLLGLYGAGLVSTCVLVSCMKSWSNVVPWCHGVHLSQTEER